MRGCYHLISKDGVETKESITIARRRVCISSACFIGFADNFRSTKLGYSRDCGVFFPQTPPYDHCRQKFLRIISLTEYLFFMEKWAGQWGLESPATQPGFMAAPPNIMFHTWNVSYPLPCSSDYIPHDNAFCTVVQLYHHSKISHASCPLSTCATSQLLTIKARSSSTCIYKLGVTQALLFIHVSSSIQPIIDGLLTSVVELLACVTTSFGPLIG